jgi:hypothetical protein
VGIEDLQQAALFIPLGVGNVVDQDSDIPSTKAMLLKITSEGNSLVEGQLSATMRASAGIFIGFESSTTSRGVAAARGPTATLWLQDGRMVSTGVTAREGRPKRPSPSQTSL